MLLSGDLFVPTHILGIKELSSRAKLLYAVILTRAFPDGFCSDSDMELGKNMRVSARTVKNHLSALEMCGLVKCKDFNTERRLYPLEKDFSLLKEFIADGRQYAANQSRKE